jgi:hypothetical protein
MQKLRASRNLVTILVFVAMLASACGHAKEVHSTPSGPDGGDAAPANRTYATTAQVLEAVKAAANITAVPESVRGSLGESQQTVEGPKPYFDLMHFDDGGTKAVPFGDWAYGDPKGSKLMVVYGDSRANMWVLSLIGVAAQNGWKLRVFGLPGCPGPDLQFQSIQTKSPNTKCDTFHVKAIDAIKTLKPDLIVTASVSNQFLADGSYPTREQWQQGWQSTFSKLKETGARLAMFGDLPSWKNNFDRCLSANLDNAQACSAAPADAVPSTLVGGERLAAEATGVLYIPADPWVCAERCEPIIADTLVFHDQYHFTKAYAEYLTGAVGDALKPAMS